MAMNASQRCWARKKGILNEHTKLQCVKSTTEGCADGYQRCSTCTEHKPFSDFHKNKKRKIGIANVCKKCKGKADKAYAVKNMERLLEYKREYYQKNRERIIAEKKEERKSYQPFATKKLSPGECCARCGGVNLHTHGPEGRWTSCRDCKSRNGREWSKRNPETVKANRKRDYESRRDKYREYTLLWRKENREKVLGYIRKRNAKLSGELSDIYVKALLGIKNPPQELIELKRVQIKIHRGIQNESKKLTQEA